MVYSSRNLKKINLLGIAVLTLCANCRQVGNVKDGKPKTGSPLIGSNPPVGKVDDEAGFFVEVLPPQGVQKTQFNLHRGVDSFDEPCKGESGKVVDCTLDADESTLAQQSFSFHYHVPSSMCAYVSVDPFYFVNRKSKLTTSIIKYVDSAGNIGIDEDLDGDIDSEDFGCFSDKGEPICCVGEYAEKTLIWDAVAGKYASPSTKVVRRTLEQCLGGPGSLSQSKTSLGIPEKNFKYVFGKGVSDEYKFVSLMNHGVGPGWISNYFDPNQHGNRAPQAFDDDIDPGVGELRVGNPYYTIACYDSAMETLASIRIQIREWNTAVDYEARRDAPTKHDESGAEAEPWADEEKNDWPDWLDFELSQIKYPDYRYQ